MRIVVTGGAGFIGARVVERLIERGHDVVAVDTTEAADHVRRLDDTLRGQVRFVLGDLRDPDVARHACEDADIVCHLASRTGPDTLDQLPAYIADNDVATGTLLHALHRQGFEGRLVLGSSTDVYGEGSYRCTEHGPLRLGRRSPDELRAQRWERRCPTCQAVLQPVPIGETTPPDPETVHAATKLHQEHLAGVYQAHHPDATLTVLRFHNVYGPDIPIGPDADGVFALFRRDIAAGRRPQVFEDGGQQRDFIHVDDAVRATVLAMTCEPGVPGTFNVASGRATTLIELATAMCVAIDSRLWPQVIGGFRPGDARHLIADPSAAETRLGFRATVGLADGLRTVQAAAAR